MQHSSSTSRLAAIRNGVSAWVRGRSRRVRAVLVAAVCVACLAVLASGWFAWDLTSGLPTYEELRRIDMAHSTSIHDVNDKPVFTIYREQRMEVPLDAMSPHLIQAILAIEDQRFYEHRGIDTVRIAGAALANLRQGRRAQGGSTITQQLARQSFLSTDKTFRRKLREVIVAARLERAYSKDQILELYLNKVYFGNGLYGVQAAALGFFGTPASDLDVAQSALLAGLVKSPSTWAPTVNLDRAIARRNVVLEAMADTGAITAEQAGAARDATVELEDALRHEETHGAYFKEQVRIELVERFGWERVYQGGLRVYTTLDMNLQKAAEAAVEAGLADLEKQRSRLEARSRQDDAPESVRPPLQAALVALDPTTGEVRALVGGRDFDESRFNRAVQAKRQPGSAFKPFVFAAALEAGQSPASSIGDLDQPVMTLQGAWVPEDEKSTATSMTLRTALRTSSNRAAVRLLEQVGVGPAVTQAEDLGMGRLPGVPSLALGSGEVTVLSITAAFGAFANKGVVLSPTLVRRVEDRDGTLLFEHELEPRQAMSEATAFQVSSMLSDVISMGTAWRARRDGFTLPAAGKTGTTNDYHDAWFIGYTPRIVTGVWVGFDQPQTIMRNAYGGDVAVPMWARFMKEATKGHKPEWYSPPSGVVGVDVCRYSGLLPSDGCSMVQTVTNEGTVQIRSAVYTDYFVRGRQPRAVCHLHSLDMLPNQRLAGGVTAGAPGRTSATPARTAGASDAAGVVSTTGEASEEVVDAAGRQPRAEAGAEPEQRRRRGFWSRLFGRGGDRDKEQDEKNDERDDEPR